MKSIIVGTAGHIDHGKTALVKVLTGIDADRLEEEKRRGITIDLGFAHMELPDTTGETIRIGFVDVPGHERFVRNMLAGTGGIDVALLVIAANESIKPQTREHFDILQLLGVKRGVTVLTKSDTVDAETLAAVRLEVEEFLKGTFLAPPQSPIVAVSSLTGAGLDELKRELTKAAENATPRDSATLARLPIDRVFTMKGFGTVVTGTLISGTIRRDDELEVFPGGQKVRVRGVQVHGQSADSATAGQRTALNLVGASTEDLSRGMMLAPPQTLRTTLRADVKLQLLLSASRPLKLRTRAHLHAHTMETVVDVKLHEATQLLPGETGFARITLPEPALLLPGDRFIIRQFSPVITIGGGVVLDAALLLRAVRNINFLETLDYGEAKSILIGRVARRGHAGIPLSRLVAETGWTRTYIESQLRPEFDEGVVLRNGDHIADGFAIDAFKKNLLKTVDQFHQQNPLVPGIAREALRAQLKGSPEVFDVLLQMLAAEGKIEIDGDLVRLTGRGVQMKDEEAESKKKIEDAFSAAGLKVPALQEVLAGLKVDKARAQKIVTLLMRDKILIKISDDLVFHHSALEQLRARIIAQKPKSPKIDVAAFKEMTGVSRKYAIPLLEYLDRERITKRVGDARIIL